MNFIAIDFETANERRNSACSIGIAIVKDGEIVETISEFIRPPELYFNPFNVGIHGITASDVADAMTFDQLWEKIGGMFANNKVIAHNASFDMSVIRYGLDEYGICYPSFDYYCTLVLARQIWPEICSHRLNDIADMLGFEFEHHDALEDAVACAKVLLQQAKLAEADSIEELAACYKVKKGRMYAGGYQPTRGPSAREKANKKK
ncbi:MAG: 3'-5' exoribonuclease [Phycisphaerae bacterium]|nr:3'-5' exoribonuclease [Phycisphaerae bacterium]